MDKPEPLKEKTKYRSKGIKNYSKKKWYMTRDIRSAVEWLKQDLCESFSIAKDIQGDITNKQLINTKKHIRERIDKAFEDVMK